MTRMSARKILTRLKGIGTPEKADVLSGFFRTGKGQYGEGDVFLGVTMPEVRKVVREFRELLFSEIEKLLSSRYHEARMMGLLILVDRFGRADEEGRKAVYDFLIAHRAAMNNWDLVDVIAPKIVGTYLATRKDRKILYEFATSDDLWERRIAIVSTFQFIREGEFDDTLAIANMFLDDPHDLIHKATGWMLREVGKRDEPTLRGFLDAHAARMPRTMLRYAIERLPETVRRSYLG